MRHHHAARRRGAAVAILGILGVAGAAFAVAAPASAGPARPVTSQSVTSQSAAVQSARAVLAPSAAASAQQVLLVNGDRLLLRAGGRVTLLRAPNAGPVVSLGRGSRATYIPLDALPYLGAGLAPGLFSPAGLSRAESSGRLRVEIAFSGQRPRLPGITITQSGDGTARGYLTQSSAQVFGAALARQARADHSRASYGEDGMFVGRVSIAPAGTSPALARSAPRSHPDFPMGEVTVRGTNEAGQPDTGDMVAVFNADDSRRFHDSIECCGNFFHGTDKFSVPAGTYWAVSWFFKAGTVGPVRVDVMSQFTVRAGRRTTVHMSARAATSQLKVITPRPALLGAYTYEISRPGRHGPPGVAGVFGDPGSTLFVNRTSTRTSVGSLKVYVGATLTSPAGAQGVPYAYHLLFAGRAGILPSERWTARPATLATVTERYYQEVPGTGEVLNETPQTPALVIGFAEQQAVPMPGEQIQYLTGSPDAEYEDSYSQYSGNYFPGGQADSQFSVRPGQHLTENWNAGPLHPQPATQALSSSLAVRLLALPTPTAYRIGNQLMLKPQPFSDNVPGHTGSFYFNYPGSRVRIGARYVIRENGALIKRGTVKNEGNVIINHLPPVTVKPRPGVVRFQLTATRRGTRYPLSPVSQTVWTWRSAPRPGATVPPSWGCVGRVFTRRGCAVQPMMTLNYRVHGLGLNEAAAPGRQVIDLTAGHIEPARPARVTGASVRVSFNGGHSWQPARVTRAGPGRFTISFRAPAGVTVTLRTSAADAAGASITETIKDAYRA